MASGVDEEERREGGTTGEGRRGESSRVIWPVQVPRGSLYESASEGEEGKRTEQKKMNRTNIYNFNSRVNK